MLKINLLERKAKIASNPFTDILAQLGIDSLDPQDIRMFVGIAIKAAVVYACVWAADFVPRHLLEQKLTELDSKIQVLDGESAKIEAELRALDRVQAEKTQIEAQEADMRSKLQIISSLESKRYHAFKVVDTISLLIPEKVWINTLSFKSGAEMELSGASWEYIPINDFVSLLKQSGIFETVVLKSIASGASRGDQGIPEALQTEKTFSLSLRLRVDAAPPALGGSS